MKVKKVITSIILIALLSFLAIYGSMYIYNSMYKDINVQVDKELKTFKVLKAKGSNSSGVISFDMEDEDISYLVFKLYSGKEEAGISYISKEEINGGKKEVVYDARKVNFVYVYGVDKIEDTKLLGFIFNEVPKKINGIFNGLKNITSNLPKTLQDTGNAAIDLGKQGIEEASNFIVNLNIPKWAFVGAGLAILLL